MSEMPADPALASAVLEIESHVAAGGWDQPARLYALVDTARIVAEHPDAARAMGLEEGPGLTPVEQESLPDQPLERTLEQIAWPADVTGCAAVLERLVLPPELDEEIPEDADEAQRFAREHPLRQEVRIVAGATRGGSTYCALRLRAHDEPQSVVDGTDLVPGLLDLLRHTLVTDDTDEQRRNA